MAFSPVEFAEAFERLRTLVLANDAGDSALLQLLDFWPRLAPLNNNPAYSSYVAEYRALLESALSDVTISDLSLDELAKLDALCVEVAARQTSIQSIRMQIARQNFYVGKLDAGLAACAKITQENVAFEKSESSVSGLSEFETFHVFVAAFDETSPATKKLLQDILDQWQAEREYVSIDRVYCLFVQNNGTSERSRGKLRVLSGSVEERGRSAQNDEITFDNQLRAADDPIVGVAYQGLAATRRYLKSKGYSRLGTSYYHARFAVADKRATYTGDSLGVAAALLAYAQLLHTEALRHDHLLPGEIACTGGIDQDGNVISVNDATIHAKVERAFFSHVKYLVLPSENVATARQHLDALTSQFPARQLLLLPISSLSAAINDHNVVRPERVCIGEFVAKQAVKYSRMAKVQVPMLMVLAYLLVCVIYPKAWPWFDWNPEHVITHGTVIEAVNRRGQHVWSYDLRLPATDDSTYWKFGNLDDDSLSELVYMPLISSDHPLNGWMLVFDDNGDTLFTRDCSVRREFPTDTLPPGVPEHYEGSIPHIQKYIGSTIIVSVVNAINPARCYVRFWDRKGNPMGWHINPGTGDLKLYEDIDKDGKEEALFYSFHNRLSCVCMYALDPASSVGVSPPLRDSDNRFHPVIPSNAKHFILFKPSIVNQKDGRNDYQGGLLIWRDGPDRYKIQTDEGDEMGPRCIDYYFDGQMNLIDVSLSDRYSRAFEQLKQEGQIPQITQQQQCDTLKTYITQYRDGKPRTIAGNPLEP
ncbi:MAG: hypothetical protein IPH59_09565 [bacterium]|nr:hypothetical protein [bacterium]